MARPNRQALTRAEVESGWKGVCLKQSRVTINTGIDALFHSVAFRDLCHSLVLVHAYGVLQEALQRLVDDGRFQCKSSMLGPLVEASKEHIAWVSFDRVWERKCRRDDIAHEAKYIPQAESKDHIQLIETNLRAWGFEVAP